MNKEQDISRIHAYLSGQLNDSEQALMDQWIKEPANHKLFTEIKEVWDVSQHYDIPSFDVDAALSRMPFAQQSDHISAQSRPVRKLSPWAMRAAAVLLALFVAFAAWYRLGGAGQTVSVATLNEETVTLDDGSIAHLHGESSLSFRQRFRGDRAVVLDGECFFEVAHDAEKSFTVRTDLGEVTVLGTKFGVDEIDEEGILEVHVTEGKVRIQPQGTSTTLDITAGQSAVYSANTGELRRLKAGDPNEVAWHTGDLQFRNARLEDVLEDLEKTFDVEIKLENAVMLDCPFNATYSDAELEHIFEDMKLLWDIRVMENSDKHYQISGGKCD